MTKQSVFISYHNSDVEIATALKALLVDLSSDFDVFLDKYSIAPGADFSSEIFKHIIKAQWFLIVCSGQGKNMAWPFFEAGQFEAKRAARSVLPSATSAHVPDLTSMNNVVEATVTGEVEVRFSDELVCLFDVEIPSPFSRYNGVKVAALQVDGKPIEMERKPEDNLQLENAACFNLLERMVKSTNRDTSSGDIRRQLRVKTHALVEAFVRSDAESALNDRPLQPRIYFIIPPYGRLLPETVVYGWEGSLGDLFSIASAATTWKQVCTIVGSGKNTMPPWVADIESAVEKIASNILPDRIEHKCRLRGTFYHVFPGRYEELKSGSKKIFISYLPSSTKAFELRQKLSVLLSGLILTIRFRERVIPKANLIKGARDKKEQVMDFYRELVSSETEAIELAG